METLSETWIDTVRNLLLEVWGHQTCQRPADWPDVLERLLERWEPLVYEAVASLAETFRNAVPEDPGEAVWRAFPRLDRVNCARLAALLIEASGASPTERPL